MCDHEEENQETETFESQGSYREMIHDQIASMSRPPLLHEAVKCKTNLGSYKEMFYKDGVLQKRVFLLGEAGSGKTTFSKHLTDVWCQTTTSPQFKDVAVFKQFQYFFYVSCRFADEMETILDMITNQLFDDDKLKEAAIYVLKHYPECCLIVLDGADEWKGSPTSETGRRRDIAGLPGMTGVENCVILITSRPWRFHALSTKSMKVFRCLTINGIKNVAKLAQRILRKLEDPVPVKSSDEFLCQVREKNMHELMKIPLILILALGGWVKNKALHNSMTINYINMIQSFIHRSKGHSGWSSSESKLRQLIPILDHLESEWRQKSNELPYIVSRYKPMQRYAGLFLSLGQLAFDQLLGKEEQSLVFSKAHFKSYLCGDDENDESLNVCLALGILSNTQTTTRNLKKLDSYTFCHKTFQEFFAALWLSSKYSREKSKLYKCLKNVDNLLGYNILIQFLCGIDPRVGKQFWLDLAEEVEIEEIKDDSKKRLQKLACKCMNEQGFDETDQASDQIYFYIPHIRIDNFISYGDFIPLKDVMLLCHVMEEYSCNIKSVYVDMHRSNQQEQALIVRSVSSCCGLQSLILQDQPNINNNISGSPVLDLQKHSLKIRGLFIECLLLPMEQLRITSLKLDNVIMTHHGFEQMGNSLSSCSGLEKLYLNKVSCSDNSCLPVLDLQKHNKLWLWNLSVECLLIHFEGVRFTSLDMFNVKMAHHGLEQLGGSLASCSGLEKLYLNRLICSEHGDRCFIPALDLQKHNKLETLKLLELSVEGLLLPLTDTRLTSLNMFNVKLAHSLEQLSGSLSSCISLNDLYLDKVACNNGDICCSLVLNLQNHNKMEGLTLCNLSVEGLVLPVEGAEITSLVLCRVTVAHRSLERLGESLMSCSGIENLILREVRCSQHRDDSCRPVQDLFNFQRLN